MNVTILVAAHKDYRMPEDSMYLPVLTGTVINRDLLKLTEKYRDIVGMKQEQSSGKIRQDEKGEQRTNCTWARDDSGDNISKKNPNYCELTALYWGWKNLCVTSDSVIMESQPSIGNNVRRDAINPDYLGLVHYRRHFTVPGRRGDKWQRILTKKQLEGRLADCDVILPEARNYFIETGYSHYAHAHHAADLDVTRQILGEKFPDYVPVFDAVLGRTRGHRFNMFIMKRELVDAYCTWLFDVLFELEKRLDIFGYSAYDARVFGFVGERLLDVWIEKNEIPYMELPCMFMESQNWLVKGGNFLRRKFLGKKE